MSSPSRRQLSEAILVMLKTQTTQKVASSVANYLVANRRTKELDMIMRDIESLRLKREGASEATAISAFELSESTKSLLHELLGDKKTHISYRHDPSLVGGVRVRALDWQLDLSVASKLKQLKQLTTQSN